MSVLIDVEQITLTTGAHESPDAGMCVMEMSAYIAGERWSDNPVCVSPVLGAFLRSFNDGLADEPRQRLKPYAKRVIGTANDGKDQKRAWMAADWIARTQLPVWLELAGLNEHASAVRASIALTSDESATQAQPVLSAAESAARSAAESAAWSAAESAAWSAAESAARSAAESAAWSALEPTVLALQESAFDLLERMVSL